ncbi:hypothetical protein [Thalassoglobus neptunius]|uniref:hypothetical protein n=1 Tax=Thalassoglobus neptunius TaxID=1938619 RepID=UPI0011B6FAD2|nr:hypothetical protein [Thalassoglobus neptunius]
MKRYRFQIVIALGLLAIAAFLWSGLNTRAAVDGPKLGPFEFEREGALSPELAAKSHFYGCANKSPKHFVQHVLLGICDGPINTLQKFAECLHETEFHHDGQSYSVYDLPKVMNAKLPVRVIASGAFDPEDKRVLALHSQMMSTYYAEKFMCFDVAGTSYDRNEYQSRVVVVFVNGRWYSMPRCRSARSFYEIADSMELTPLDPDPAI